MLRNFLLCCFFLGFTESKRFCISALLVLLAVSSIGCNMTSLCSRSQLSMAYLEIAADMIAKAKLNTPICNDCEHEHVVMQRAVDCADIFHMGFKESGVYKVRPMNRLTEDKSIDVYCDMETDGGGWTVIQRRGDFGSPKDFFYKNWTEYKEGFGDLEKDFWLGNDNIYSLSNQKLYSARVDLEDVKKEKAYAHYDMFWLDDENTQYTLHISGFSGDAGDSMTNPDHRGTQTTNNQKFSTKDRKNDSSKVQNCALDYKGGWWYNACHYSNLNGLYLKGKHESYADGVNWYTWRGHYESLEWTEIKIRPKNFKRSTNRTSTLVH